MLGKKLRDLDVALIFRLVTRVFYEHDRLPGRKLDAVEPAPRAPFSIGEIFTSASAKRGK